MAKQPSVPSVSPAPADASGLAIRRVPFEALHADPARAWAHGERDLSCRRDEHNRAIVLKGVSA